jgi:hypothetical protein
MAPEQQRHSIDSFWCRSETAPIVGYWSRTFIGWVAYREDIPLIRHDVTGWEPIADQAAARAAGEGQVATRRHHGDAGHGEGAASSSRAVRPAAQQASAGDRP